MPGAPPVPDEHNRDMIVPLLALPDSAPIRARVEQAGVVVRRARAWELSAVRAFVEEQFTRGWADEVSCCWSRTPLCAFVALDGDAIIGFAGYNCAHPGVFGPTGVRQDRRGDGIGAALLFRCLEDMKALGYIYAIIGAVGPAAFYERTCGAMLLPAGWPSYVTTPG
jgi:predicted N-acetyltransferase YhbS